MWIILTLIFSAGEPVSVTMSSMEACHTAVAESKNVPRLVSASCSVTDTNWKKHF